MPNQAVFMLGMCLLWWTAFLLSLFVIPLVKPIWSVALGSWSGVICSSTAFLLSAWAFDLSSSKHLPLVEVFAYLFVFGGIISVFSLARFLSSRRSRIGWYGEFIEGCRKAGEYDWCIAAGQEAIALMSGDPGYNQLRAGCHNQLGVTYFRKGEYRAAVEEYTNAINLGPTGKTIRGDPGYKLALAYTNRAEAYIELGELHAAIADCNAALAVDPDDEYARNLEAEAEGRLRADLRAD